MSFGTERLSDIFDGLPDVSRGPSLDAYLVPSDDDDSSHDELDAAAFVAWMKQNVEAARRERQQLQAKEEAEKQSAVRKRLSKQTGSASTRFGRSVSRQEGQGLSPQKSRSTRRSLRERPSRKSFNVSEIGGRKISLEVQESASDTEVGRPSPLPSDQGTPEERHSTQLLERSVNLEESPSAHELKGSSSPKRSHGTQLLEKSNIPEESLDTQLLEKSNTSDRSPVTQLLEKSHTSDGSPVTQLLEGSDIASGQLQMDSSTPKDSPVTHLLESTASQQQKSLDSQKESSGRRMEDSNTSAFKRPRPSYLEPIDQATSTYVEVSCLKFDSTSSDDQGTGREASRQVHRSASREVGEEDPHEGSIDGDQNVEMDAQDVAAKESIQSAPVPTVSAKKRPSNTTPKKRKKKKICMPRQKSTTAKKPGVRHSETDNTAKKELHLTISPLAQKEKQSHTVKKSMSRGSSNRRTTKPVVLSPKSSAKHSHNQGEADDVLTFHEVTRDTSPVVSLTPPTASPSRTRPRESPRVTRKASVSAKKRLESSSRVRSPRDPNSSVNASLATTRHESMKSMRENAISIIASITEEEARMDHSVSAPDHQGGRGSILPVSRRRQSDASVLSGYGLEQTPSSTVVVALDEQRDEEESDYDATMLATESDSGGTEGATMSAKTTGKKKKKKSTTLCYKLPRRQRKQSLEDVSVELSQLTDGDQSEEEDSGSEPEDVEYSALTDISAVASRPVKLDGFTPIDKGIPLNRSQLLKTVGGHMYKYSPVKGRKGVTPGRRRTKRTRVPVLAGGETYAYTVDENVLHTVAGRVRPLEEVKERQQKRKNKPSIRRKPLTYLDMTFSGKQNEESVATFPLQTADGEQLEVEFMRHLSACPKKTLVGSDAAKSEPVIICPMYANESCSIGMIFVNAECEKPHQVTTGASLVFLLLSGKIEVELQSDGQNYVKEIEPLSRFWIPEDVTYSIHNVDRVPAELVYFRLRQQ